jgi:YD repeat-containing protein
MMMFVAARSFAADSGVAPNVISLPDGPGSISGLGEEFVPAANSGTAHYGVAIELPEGSGGLKPSIELSYDGGRGNSELGFGWSLGLPAVQRQTDKGLPRYGGSDAFIYRDGTTNEELVLLTDGSYRLKTEGAFIRAVPSGDGWEVRTKSGIVYKLGTTPTSRIVDETGTKVFAWLIETIEDLNGNAIAFAWNADGSRKYLHRITYNDYGTSERCEVEFSYEARSDALADFRAGFPVVTARRLTSLSVHRGGNLVRRYDLAYDVTSRLSRLAAITLVGSDGASSMPPLSFTYAGFAPGEGGVVEMDNPPGQGLAAPGNALLDFNADGLPDLIVTAPGDYRYYLNEDGTRWADSMALVSSPSYDLSQEGVRLADIDGDGAGDIVIARADGNKYLPGTGQASWAPSVPFDVDPVGFDLSDPNTRFVDLDGDRMADVLRTGASGCSAWIHQGGGAFERLSSLPKIDASDDVLFSDPRVMLADVNGDGLVDVARLRSENFFYWPSAGYGLFASPVEVAGLPHVDEEARLRLVDVNGDGLADVLYLGVNYVWFRLNRGDGTLSDEIAIHGTPVADPVTTSVQLADMNGNGTTDVVWVDVSAGPSGAWRYIDLAGEVPAGLIASVDNGLGKRVSVDYESSTAQMVRDANAGQPWTRTMPFPMSVIKRVVVEDGLGWRSITDFSYRDGFYDGAEREFRGFAGARKMEEGDASIEGLVVAQRFDVGDAKEALQGRMLSEEQSSVAGKLYQRVVNQWQAHALELGTDGREVVFPGLAASVTEAVEGDGASRFARIDYVYDNYGNVVEERKHGEVASASDDGSVPFGDDEIFISRSFATNETAWIVDRVSRESVYDAVGEKISEIMSYYDGAVFQGLAFGQVDRGNLMRQESWLGTEDRFVPMQRYRRDAWGNVTAMLDAEGGRREIAYDAAHTYPVKERVLTGDGVLEFAAEYDAVFGSISRSQDPNGVATSFSYDPFGRLAAVVKPGDTNDLPTISYVYTVASPVSVVETRQREVSGEAHTLDAYHYMDGLGRSRAKVTEDAGGTYAITEATAYNARGKKQFAAEPFRCEGISESCSLYGTSLAVRPGIAYAYDALARVVRITNPDGTAIAVDHFPMGEVISDEDDLDMTSEHAGTPTTRRYDGQGRLQAISFATNAGDVTTSFAYDGMGNIVTIVDPAGNERRQAYDGLGRMIALDDPNAGRREFVFDDVGRLVKKIKPDGYAVAYRYEPTTGRMLAKNLVTSAADDAWEVQFHYDAPSGEWEGHGSFLKGKLAWVQDEAGKEYYGYDARGNLVAKRRSIGGRTFDFAFGMDAADRTVAATYPDGFSIATTYDARGLIASVGSYLLQRTYDAAGRAEVEALGNGSVRSYEYDVRGRLTRLTSLDAAGKAIQNFAYDYDAAGNILGIADERSEPGAFDQSQTLAYDDLYRLVRADLAGGTISWTYDAVGNITGRASTLSDANLNTPEMRYGEEGAGPYALTSAGDTRFAYDANGNLVSMPGQSLVYDAEDRLANVEKENGTLISMVYDHAGLRKVKQVIPLLCKDGGGEVDPACEGYKEYLYIDPLYEVRDGTAYRYVWAGGRRIARIDANAAEAASDE